MNDSLFKKEIHVYKREYSVDVNEIIKISFTRTCEGNGKRTICMEEIRITKLACNLTL